MRIAETMMPEIEQEMAQTRKKLARVPDDKFSFKPHEKSMDMGALALHIAMMADWGADTLVHDDFDVAPVNGPAYQMPTAKTSAELLALFSEYRHAEGAFESQLRRILFRAMCRRCGHGLQVGPGVVVKHPETMEFGDQVFIGAQTMIQGRFDGR